MIRSILILFFIAVFINDGALRAQNIFDSNHTSAFANYLYKSSQFKLAAEEYERLSFMEPANDTARLFLIKSYRKAGLVDKGIKRTEDLFANVNTAPPAIFNEYVYLLVLDNQFAKVNSVVNSSSFLSGGKKDYISMNVALLSKDWKDARKLFAKNDSLPDFSLYKPVIDEADHLKHRSAGAAVLFSALVPGTGKLYTGEWKDGIVSFALIGLCAFESYRGFHRTGIKSGFGWIYGGLGFGFYMGNLYGTYKSAKKFNTKYEDALVKKSRSLFMSNL